MTLPSRYNAVIAAFVVGAVLAGSLVAFAFSWLPAGQWAAAVPWHSAAPARSGPGADDDFDRLRRGASGGDELSNDMLSNALLDRYDALGDTDDLYEALVWIDRRWNTFGNAPVVARAMANNYCSQRVVRWHSFCILGE
jgi:hypothetical protein